MPLLVVTAISQLGTLLLVGILSRGIYRLFLSPLARFPGPRLAALTSLYEGYYDCVKDGGGRYHVQIGRMHDRYGPIVRINPWELHIRDPDWNEIYKITRRASKPEWYYRFLGPPGNAFSSPSSETHRLRRDAISPYFSPGAIARHQPEVERLVQKLLSRFRNQKKKEKEKKENDKAIIRLDDAFRALATDGATVFAFREPFGHLDSPDFEHAGNKAVRKYGLLGMVNRLSKGWVLWAMKTLVPPWLAIRLSPGSLGVAGFFKQLDVAVKRGLESAGRDKFVAEEGEAQTDLVRQILCSSLPPEEKTPWRVTRECSSVTLAGTETTGSVLAFTVFHLLSRPEMAGRLREEVAALHEKCGRLPTYQELKELPYLTGVVNEGLRLDGVAGRLPRADPKEDMAYRGYIIPKGTYVSTTQNDTSLSPDIFPEPHAFLPERWLDDAERRRPSKYHMPFGRGARSCIGMEIALMEIYLCLGRLFGPEAGFELELHDTVYERDVKMYHEYFSPFPKSDRGVRAFIT